MRLQDEPARCGPGLFRFLLHGSWLARAVHGRCDGSQETAALDRGAQHSHKSWLENRASRRAHPAVLLRGSSEDRYVHSLRNRAPGVPIRDRKRSFIEQPNQLATATAPSHANPPAGPRSTRSSPTTRWRSPASNRPRRPDSGRAAARRPGRAPGVESNRRFETHTKHAGHGQLPHARPADELQDETDDATPRQAARLRRARRLAHGRQ